MDGHGIERHSITPAAPRSVKGTTPSKKATSGEMLADGIRVRGLELLGKYHIQEGLPLCLQLHIS